MMEKREKVLHGTTHRYKTACGKLYITINANGDEKPIEILGRMGKTGGCVAAHIEGLCRMCSVALQNGVPSEEIIRHLEGIRCPSWNENEDGITSCSDAFSKALKTFIKKDEKEIAETKCSEKKIEEEG